jgi:2-dehydropantoate 2-reductase
MWEDLEAGRRTEIDWINGEVVRLAERLGRRSPINSKLIELICEAEEGSARRWRGKDLLNALKS